MNINSLIDLSAGITLTCVSLGGLKFINGRLGSCSSKQNSCSKNTETSNCNTDSRCSRWNMNLGLSGMAVTGGLMLYRGFRTLRN